MYAKTDSRDSERPEKARRNDFCLRVPTGKRDERERQRNTQSGPRKIKGCQVKTKPAKTAGFSFCGVCTSSLVITKTEPTWYALVVFTLVCTSRPRV